MNLFLPLQKIINNSVDLSFKNQTSKRLKSIMGPKSIREFIGNDAEQTVDGGADDVKSIATKKAKKSKGKSERISNPSKYVDVKPTLDEAAADSTAVISFGRMNPITVGHEKLANAVIRTGVKNNATPLIFLSHSQDAKKNPLSYEKKIKFAKTAFGTKLIQKSKARTIIDVAKELQGKFENLIVVAGSDRVEEFNTLLNKYNGKDYTYKSIKVVSAGERDPDADDVSGMSASKMRALAKDGDMESFKKGLPAKLRSQGKAVFNSVRTGMNVNESTQFNEDQNHPLVKKARKAHKQGVWDGNVNKEGKPIVHINGKPVHVESIYEALTRQQRLKRKMIMRRLRSKIKMGRRRAMRRKATIDTLQKRARRQVIRALKQRFAKSRDYADLPYSARQRIDDRVAKIPDSRLNILMRRMLPKVKQDEKDRIASRIAKSNPSNPVKRSATVVSVPKITEDVNQKFEAFNESRKTDIQRAIDLAEQLGANQNYAIKEIEKISKGITKHAKVKQALVEAASTPESYNEYTVVQRVDEGASYHSGLAKSTASKRKAQFAKQAKMDDDNPAAYKPAPGDKRSKTKPSNHTTKFQQMFGEKSSNLERAYLRKPHMLLKQDGSVKLDQRFKMFRKPKLDEMVTELDGTLVEENLNNLAETVEFIFESNPEAAIKNKAEKTGISYGILKKVFDRGVAAWRTGHRPGTTPTQWGLARINSFATGGKTRTTADKDLWAQHKGK
jgi:nicotinic acid mononucleotide adenylyltransferase